MFKPYTPPRDSRPDREDKQCTAGTSPLRGASDKPSQTGRHPQSESSIPTAMGSRDKSSQTSKLQQSVSPSHTVLGTQCEKPGSDTLEQDYVILFTPGSMSPWDSDKDGRSSGSLQEEIENNRIRDLICKEGVSTKILKWHLKQRRSTIQVLSDSFLQACSGKDQHCRVVTRNYAHLGLWTRAVRKQDVSVPLPITVIAVRCIRHYECLEPLKNALTALCRAIRTMSMGTGQIFITNRIPSPGVAPILGARI